MRDKSHQSPALAFEAGLTSEANSRGENMNMDEITKLEWTILIILAVMLLLVGGVQ